MTYTIKKSIERKRGCGYRIKGGFYFREEKSFYPCGMLPLPLISCTCCGHIPNQTRGFQWMNISYFKYICDKNPCLEEKKKCLECSFSGLFSGISKIAIDWVGLQGYPTSKAFNVEAKSAGVSRRIAVRTDENGNIKTFGLKGFKVGEDFIALIHPKACKGYNENMELQNSVPGIFKIYKPQCIEYIVKGGESKEYLQALYDQGVKLIDVVYDKEQQQKLFND